MDEVGAGPESQETLGQEGGEALEERREIDPESVKLLREENARLKEEKAALIKERDELRKLAYTDELTTIPNRRDFNETLENLLGKVNIFLAFVDVDKLKKINEDFGHSGGDEALKKTSQVLTNAVRSETDIVYRIGGDEFVIIGPCSSSTQPERVGHSIMERVTQQTEQSLEKPKGLELGLSMGVAIARKGENISAEELKTQASQKMFKNKRAKK